MRGCATTVTLAGRLLLTALFALTDQPVQTVAWIGLAAGGPVAHADSDGDGGGGDGDSGGRGDRDSDGRGDSDRDGDSDSDRDADDDRADDRDDGDDDDDDDEGDDDDNDDDEDRERDDRGRAGGGTDTDGRRVATRATRRTEHAPAQLAVAGMDDGTLERLQSAGFTVLRRAQAGGRSLVVLRVPRGMPVGTARERVAGLTPGGTVDYNSFYRPDGATGAEAVCAGVSCAAAEAIGWPFAALQTGDCAAGVRLGIVDTAINADHASLAGRDLQVLDLPDDGAPASGRRHGTAIASMLIADPESRAPGLLPGASLLAADAFHRGPGADERADVVDLVLALDRLAARGVRVINLSLSGPPNALLEEEVERLERAGVVLVAAAGNRGPRGEPMYPAAYGPVIAVTAIDRSGAIYPRANQGSYIDLAAPGVEVWAAASIRGARPLSGTSFATPFVSAVAAVLAARDADATPAEIRARMALQAVDLGAPGRDPVFGWGRVNAAAICEDPPPPPADIATPEAPAYLPASSPEAR